MKSVLDIRKDKEREKFLRFSPLERTETMHRVLMDVIALRAKPALSNQQIAGASSICSKTFELAKRTGRDKKLAALLMPAEEETGESTEELL